MLANGPATFGQEREGEAALLHVLFHGQAAGACLDQLAIDIPVGLDPAIVAQVGVCHEENCLIGGKLGGRVNRLEIIGRSTSERDLSDLRG